MNDIPSLKPNRHLIREYPLLWTMKVHCYLKKFLPLDTFLDHINVAHISYPVSKVSIQILWSHLHLCLLRYFPQIFQVMFCVCCIFKYEFFFGPTWNLTDVIVASCSQILRLEDPESKILHLESVLYMEVLF